jgi:hypothetical protein
MVNESESKPKTETLASLRMASNDLEIGQVKVINQEKGTFRSD